MIISDIQLHELLASKIGRSEAQGLVEFVEAKMDKKLEEKTNILVSKEDLSNTKVEIVKWMVATGIALAGIMVALMVGMVKYLHAVN
jgi:cytochrome c-type biogenesis protein CcmH/NrfG